MSRTAGKGFGQPYELQQKQVSIGLYISGSIRQMFDTQWVKWKTKKPKVRPINIYKGAWVYKLGDPPGPIFYSCVSFKNLIAHFHHHTSELVHFCNVL